MSAVLYLASPVHLCFFKGFVENTQLGLPFLILGLGALLDVYARRATTASVVAAAAALSVACLMHGQYLFVLPSLPLTAWLASRTRRHRWRPAVLSLMSCAAFLGLGLLFLVATGQKLVPGNVAGGGDARMFVPWGATSSPFERHVMLSLPHLREVANIMVSSSPFILLLPFLIVAGFRPLVRAPTKVLTIPVAGYTAFVLLWSFDLGVPGDLDLMLTLGLTVVAWSAAWLARGVLPARRGRVLMLLVAGCAFSWWSLWGLVAEDSSTSLALEFSGAVSVRTSGITEVVVDSSATSFGVELRGPPGHAYVVGGARTLASARRHEGPPPWDLLVDPAHATVVLSGQLDWRGHAAWTIPPAVVPSDGFYLQAVAVLGRHCVGSPVFHLYREGGNGRR